MCLLSGEAVPAPGKGGKGNVPESFKRGGRELEAQPTKLEKLRRLANCNWVSGRVCAIPFSPMYSLVQ
jgi:hypothetical protein